MPFELGLAMGAKTLVAEEYKMPAYISDLGGNDPGIHDKDKTKVISLVRDFLHTNPDGTIRPGPAKLLDWFKEFEAGRSALAKEFKHEPDEISGFRNYRTFAWVVSTYVERLPAI